MPTCCTVNTGYHQIRMSVEPRTWCVLPWNDLHPAWHQPGDDAVGEMPLRANVICKNLAAWPGDQRTRSLAALFEIALELHPVPEAGDMLVCYRQYLDGADPDGGLVGQLREACIAIHEPARLAYWERARRRKLRMHPLAQHYHHSAALGATPALAGVAISLCTAMTGDGTSVFDPEAASAHTDSDVMAVLGACSTVAQRVTPLWRRWWRVLRCRQAFRH